MQQGPKNRINWRAVFAESAFIGASIILAFALQDWDEQKDIEERTLIALCNVKSELIYNRVLIKNDYIPRQNGLLAMTNASISLLKSHPEEELPESNLKQMLQQDSLRYSAWNLAGESGYLLHANFQLATEIGALFDYQEDRYQSIIMRINDLVLDGKSSFQDSQLEYYAKLTSYVSEWILQTTYLEQKYEDLFAREDFNALQCGQ